MQPSAAGLALIQQSEGFSATVYLDATGLKTIGYGHRLLPGESFPNGVTQAQAAAMLTKDVASAAAQVTRLVRVPLTQGQFDALVDFVYNLGATRLLQSTLLRDLNAKQYAAAAQQLLLWNHAGTRVLAGLTARRAAEYTLFTGKAPATKAATQPASTSAAETPATKGANVEPSK